MIEDLVKKVIEAALREERRLNPGESYAHKHYPIWGQRALERGEGRDFIRTLCQTYWFDEKRFIDNIEEGK